MAKSNSGFNIRKLSEKAGVSYQKVYLAHIGTHYWLTDEEKQKIKNQIKEETKQFIESLSKG